jgi:hypothetical protein
MRAPRSAGGAMANEAAIEKVDEELRRHRAQIDAAERQIREDADRIVGVLQEDFPVYLQREIKARFVSAPDFADAMPAETLAALKRDVDDEGTKAAADIAGALRDPALWLADVELPDGPFELTHLAGVWQQATRIDVVLEGLLTKYRFPSAGARAQYKAPTWFVSGTLLKTLMEAYRTHARERARLRRTVDELEAKRRTMQLGLKWDATP